MVTDTVIRKRTLQTTPSADAGRLPAAPSNSYLSAKCVVRPVDEKGGHAVFATEPIRKGELLVVWSGTLVDGVTLDSLPASVRRYSLQVEEDHFLVSLTDCEPPDYVNHSCGPNAGLRGQIALVAMRDIDADEEITYDYAMSDGSAYDEFACRCGAADCRHWVSSQDWRTKELWNRYDGYFSPYLAARIASLKRANKVGKIGRARRDLVNPAP